MLKKLMTFGISNKTQLIIYSVFERSLEPLKFPCVL